MSPESVADPGVLASVELSPDAPTPADCLPPAERPTETVELAPGWVAVTDRELVSYHPERDPAVVHTSRHNLTGVALRRAGGRELLPYLPGTVVGAIVSFVLGVVLLAVDPAGFVPTVDGPGADRLVGMVESLAWATAALGVVLVFAGLLAGLGVLALVAYWLVSREVLLVFERGDADPVTCPTTRPAGTRAVRALERALSELEGDATSCGGEAG